MSNCMICSKTKYLCFIGLMILYFTIGFIDGWWLVVGA